jgi:hypothetical protein
MPRLTHAGFVLALLATRAQAQTPTTPADSTPPAPDTTAAAPGATTTAAPPVAPEDLSDQDIGAEIGLSSGGRVTPGGLRLAGHYLYQLNAADWFDGSITFTYGGGGASCFRDRSDAFVCDHGLADGTGVEVGATVRRFLGGKGQYWPFVRAGVGAAIVRFSDDEVTGLALSAHGGAGLRVSVSPDVAVIGLAELVLGVGELNHGLGAEPLFGLAVGAGAEFRL